jgi:hypothetical protein
LLVPCLATTVQAQNKPTAPDSVSIARARKQKPEIFTSGFIDIMNSGQVNASARFIRLYIGEPGKFAIPLSFYSGVSSNNFQNQTSSVNGTKGNEQLVTAYINPLSGLINLSSDGIIFFKKTQKITKTGFTYHIGERVLTGYKTGQANNPQTGRPVNFFNSFGSLGLYFQTGAWERSNSNNMGLFWISFRYISCYSSAKQIKEFLPDIKTNGFYDGWSLGFGVEINNLINIKALYYRYSKKPEIDYYLPIYQFSFNYSLKN